MKYIIVLLLFFSCKKESSKLVKEKDNISEETISIVKIDTLLYTNGYDFPVGKPDAKQYYNAQKFQENNHLGDDWNGVGGGNTDKGDAIFAIANGYVSFAEDLKGGWGKVVRIIHYNPDKSKVESLYAHCESILVKQGQIITKGDKIATIGTADGTYLAHLHFEIRNKINRPIGPGYSSDTTGYLNPTNYIKTNR